MNIKTLKDIRNLSNRTLHNVLDFVSVMSVSSGNRIFVIGDSHVVPLGWSRGVFRKYLGPITLNRFGRSGEARKSFEQLRFLWPINKDAEDIRSLPTLVLSVGEIDLRVHVGRQATIQETTPFAVIDQIVKSAVSAVAELRRLTRARIVFLAPTPPTDIVFNPNYPINGSLEERVVWRQYFSSRIEIELDKTGISNIRYVDVSDRFVTNRGVLSPTNSDGNVHYSRDVGRFIIDRICSTD